MNASANVLYSPAEEAMSHCLWLASYVDESLKKDIHFRTASMLPQKMRSNLNIDLLTSSTHCHQIEKLWFKFDSLTAFVEINKHA